MKKVDSLIYILDSFALLAYLEQEAGADKVQSILRRAESGQADLWLSIVNYGEVLYITERERGIEATHKAIGIVDQLSIRVAEADRVLTFAAAHVKAQYAVSYADAFAIALAQSLGGHVVTGDPEFEKVESLVEVEWIDRVRS